MPPEWLRLVDRMAARYKAEGKSGIGALIHELKVTRMTLWRIANGQTEPSLELRRHIEKLAKREGVPSPFAPPMSKKVDTRFLKLLGEGIRKGYPIPEASREHAKRRISNDQLVHLAETSEDEDVLIAVTQLLEQD